VWQNILRATIASAIAITLYYGILYAIQRYLPELLRMERGAPLNNRREKATKGQHVDVTVGEEESAPSSAHSDDHINSHDAATTDAHSDTQPVGVTEADEGSVAAVSAEKNAPHPRSAPPHPRSAPPQADDAAAHAADAEAHSTPADSSPSPQRRPAHATAAASPQERRVPATAAHGTPLAKGISRLTQDNPQEVADTMRAIFKQQ